MSLINEDQFFSGLFETGLSDPNCKAYLPDLIRGCNNPVLVPFKQASIDLGQQSLGGVLEVDIQLSDFEINGLDNVSVSQAASGYFTVTGLCGAFCAQFGNITAAEGLQISANFTLGTQEGNLEGTLTVSISAASLQGAFTLAGTNFSDMTVSFSALTAAVPDNVMVNPDITFDGGGAFWANLFEGYLKKPTTVQLITGKLNDAVVGLLPDLSNEITTLVRNAISGATGA